jgi:hypothetical protein
VAFDTALGGVVCIVVESPLKLKKAMNRKVNSIFSIIIGTLTLFLSAGKSNASILSATSLIQGVSGFTLNWDDLNSDGIIQVNEIPYPVISQPQFSGFNITNGPSWDVLYSYGIPDIPGVTSGFGQNGYWLFDSSLSPGSVTVPVGVWDYSTFGSVPPSTLSLSGNLGSSSLPFLSGGSFSGIGELPSFNIDDLFLPGGVALTSSSRQFFDSSGQLLPSEITESYIRAINPIAPPAGTPFQAEIVSKGIIWPYNSNTINVPPGPGPTKPCLVTPGLACEPPPPLCIDIVSGCEPPGPKADCLAAGGIWFANQCFSRGGPLTTLSQDMIELQNKLLAPGVGALKLDLRWLSGTLTVDLTGGTSVTTSVASANFSLSPQAVPEPTSILSLLALGTLGAASTLKRKLKPSQSTEKETTKVG